MPSAATRTWSTTSPCGSSRPASSAAGFTSTSPPRTTSRTSGTACSRSGAAASASGAGSRSRPRSAPGGCAGYGITVGPFANAIAPALLVAQAVGRIGNYFNKELFGKPTTLPWGLEIPFGYRPAGYTQFATFQPSFLYELIWDLALAALLVWLGHHVKIKPWGLFALYVAGYSAYRIFEETIRIDSSEHFLGLRLNMFVAIALAVVGIVWFAIAQTRPDKPYTVLPPEVPETSGATAAPPDEVAAGDPAGDSAAGDDPSTGDAGSAGDDTVPERAVDDKVTEAEPAGDAAATQGAYADEPGAARPRSED